MRANLIVLFVAVALVILYLLRRVVLLIYLGIIFAVIFTPLVGYIQRIRVRRWSPGKGAAILILLALVCAAMAIFLLFALPPILSDTQGLASDMPQRIAGLQQKIRSLPFGEVIAGRLNPSSLSKYAGELVQSVFSIFKGVAGGLTALLTLALLTAYFILDGSRSFQWSLSLVPLAHRERLQTSLLRAAARAQRWLLGQALLMLILGSSSTLVFGLLGINYFYALGVFAGLANFVPILGPIATVVVAGFVALLQSPMKLLGVIIFYAIYQQVENAYLTPRIMQSSVHLSPVAVILALAVGGEAAGILGAMVAVPTAAILATLADEYAVRKDPEAQEKLRAA